MLVTLPHCRIKPDWVHLGAGRMPKRLRAMLLGTEDAVPGDYVLALVAIIGVIAALLIGMVS